MPARSRSPERRPAGARAKRLRSKRHSRKRLRPKRLGFRAKFWLTLGPRTLFGEGKAELLDLVQRLGSLRRAAARMRMSYRYAWGLLRELERSAGFKFLERSREGGGRLRLTERGRRFVQDYRAFRAPLDAAVARSFRRVFRR